MRNHSTQSICPHLVRQVSYRPASTPLPYNPSLTLTPKVSFEDALPHKPLASQIVYSRAPESPDLFFKKKAIAE